MQISNKKSKDIKILGIDPSSTATGWGIIQEQSGVLTLVDCGVIKAPSKIKDNFSLRLKHIYFNLCEICEKYKPEEAGIEQVFVSKNALSALKLGQARGVAIAACAQNNINVFDYEATKVKQAIVGFGRAEKEQVAFMVQTMLNIKNMKKQLDTTDALAIAICHANMRKFITIT